MKRSKKTVCMMLALLVLLGGYFLVQRLTSAPETTAEKGDFPLVEKTAGDIARMQWVKDEEAFDFTCADGVWKKTDEEAYPCSQTVLSAMANNLISLSASQKLENASDLSAYGLSEPAFSVTVTWQDGSETVYHMGNATPFDDGYYMHLSGRDDVVYITAKSLRSLFYKSLADMADLPDLPDLSTADRLVVEGKLDVSRKETSSTLSSADLWYDTESGEPLNGATIDSYISSLSALSWTGVHISAPTEEELTALHLTGEGTDITVYAGGEAILTLHVGLANPADKVHYVCVGDDDMIYTARTTNISAILSADSKNMPRTAIADCGLADLEHVIYAIGDTTWQFDVSATEAVADDETTEEDESAEAVVTVTLNGENTDTANAAAIWSRVTALAPQGRAEADGAEEVLLTLTAKDKEGRILSLSFHPLDADYYWADISHGTPLRFSAADVDALIRALKSYQ